MTSNFVGTFGLFWEDLTIVQFACLMYASMYYITYLKILCCVGYSTILPPHYRYPFTPDQVIPECDWEVFLRETASMIVEEQTPKK